MQTKALSSEFLRKRGSCCKSNCLHCPYGVTLRNFGVMISALDPSNEMILNNLLKELVPTSSVSNSLLAGAFGKQETYAKELACLLTLKDIPCGIAYVKDHKLLKYYLLEEFSDQGIDSSYLEGIISN